MWNAVFGTDKFTPASAMLYEWVSVRLTRTLISETIWASHYDIDTNLLDVYMSRLRSKLEAADASPVFKTVRGVGYQLL